MAVQTEEQFESIVKMEPKSKEKALKVFETVSGRVNVQPAKQR